MDDDLQVRVRRGRCERSGYVTLATEAAEFDQGALVVRLGRREVVLNPVEAALDEYELVAAGAEARRLLRNAGYRIPGLWWAAEA